MAAWSSHHHEIRNHGLFTNVESPRLNTTILPSSYQNCSLLVASNHCLLEPSTNYYVRSLNLKAQYHHSIWIADVCVLDIYRTIQNTPVQITHYIAPNPHYRVKASPHLEVDTKYAQAGSVAVSCLAVAGRLTTASTTTLTSQTSRATSVEHSSFHPSIFQFPSFTTQFITSPSLLNTQQ